VQNSVKMHRHRNAPGETATTTTDDNMNCVAMLLNINTTESFILGFMLSCEPLIISARG